MKEVGKRTPFILVYYGTDGCGGWQPLDVPLRTVTTLDRFALVEPTSKGHTMRMLQPTELRRAMGFPASYRFPNGTRREKIQLLGNAVCPPVMKSLVAGLLQQ
jgi:DNA (cytosine-5)-methyltransferase 1